MLTTDDLFTSLTEEQVFQSMMSILEALGIPANSWPEGGTARTIVRVVARTFANFTTIFVAAIQSQFLGTAIGGWLTLLAYYVYKVTRIDATFATGQVRFTNTGGGVFPQAARTVTMKSATTGKTYTNVNSFNLTSGTILSPTILLVDVIAIETGSASSAPPGTVDTLVTVMTDVAITNPVSVVGTDQETDANLRQRCLDRLGTFSLAGPRSAYAYCARSALRLDGSPVDINRDTVSPGSSTGIVTIYVASPSGPPIASDVVAIQALVDEIARPDTVTATVVAATEVPLSETITVWARATPGLSAADLQTMVGTALTTFMSTYPIGGIRKPPSLQGYLYGDKIAAIAQSAHPAIFDVDGATGDLAIGAGQVAVLATTINIQFADVPS